MEWNLFHFNCLSLNCSCVKADPFLSLGSTNNGRSFVVKSGGQLGVKST